MDDDKIIRERKCSKANPNPNVQPHMQSVLYTFLIKSLSSFQDYNSALNDNVSKLNTTVTVLSAKFDNANGKPR